MLARQGFPRSHRNRFEKVQVRLAVEQLQMHNHYRFLYDFHFTITSNSSLLVPLSHFCSNLFFMKTAKDFSDGHIWFSVVSRPPCSTFTRVQRVSCCFSLLLCTMLTSIMFWGIPTDPSEQTMDLGMTQYISLHINYIFWLTTSLRKILPLKSYQGIHF